MQKTDLPGCPVTFEETQKFRQAWVWALLLVSAAVPVGSLLHAIPQSASLKTNAVIALSLLFLPILFYLLQLQTKVAKGGVYVRFFPIHRKWRFISRDEITAFEKVSYHPLMEYGGWGIRYGRNGKAYNTSGNQGIRFTFADGKKLLIGTGKPDEFNRAVTAIMKR